MVLLLANNLILDGTQSDFYLQLRPKR